MTGRGILFFVILVFFVGSVRAQVTTTRPMPGITFEQDVRSDPPLHFYVVTVDLTDPRIHLKVCRGGKKELVTPPWETMLMPVSAIAERDGLSIAVNGSLFQGKDFRSVLGYSIPYFLGNWARACGWTMSDGVLFSGSPVNRDWPSLVVDERGKVTIGPLDRVPMDARQIVSGIWQIVTDGRITADSDSNNSREFASHTAVGIDRDGKLLTLFVVDGRRPKYSIGMGWHQIAQEMSSRGAWNALLLDGGGSTTLVMKDKAGKTGVVNQPSDGHDFPIELSIERCVADALGVVIDGAATRPVR